MVRIERMAPEGAGLGRAQGSSRIVFVPYAAPGDLVKIEVTSEKATFLRGRISALLESGRDRVDPPCPLHHAPDRTGPVCGGCDWQQLSYPSQLEAKRELVIDVLRRIAKVPEPQVEACLASPQPWAYRNKVQIPFRAKEARSSKVQDVLHSPERAAPREPLAGFYEAGSHRIVPMDQCPVQTDLSIRIFRKVRELATRLGWSVYDEDRHRGWLRHLYIRTNTAGQALAALVTSTDGFPRLSDFIQEMRSSFPELVSLQQNIQPMKGSVILGPSWKRLWGSDDLEERIGALSFYCSPGSFLQVNTGASAVLYDQVLRALNAGHVGFPTVIDVYCGVGTISLWLAQAAGRVTGIEESKQAVRNAVANARRNRVRNVRFLAGKAEALLPRALRDAEGPVAVVVDPPRKGLAPPVLRALTSRAVDRIVYVSCDPATFARDLCFLARSGFFLRSVQPVDLFPQTSHVELVGLLDRPRKHRS